MAYNKYTPEDKLFVKTYYPHLSNAELAARLGVGCPERIRALARRLGLKWRAENGAPKWREPKIRNHNLGRLAA